MASSSRARRRVGADVMFTVPCEQRLRYTSSAGGLGRLGFCRPRWRSHTVFERSTGVLPNPPAHPGDTRSIVRAHSYTRRTEITIGRQFIGWLRGVVFGAVDLFAPFSPLEADREWRRGVDAVRTDTKLTDRSFLDIVGAFGTRWDRSALAARVRSSTSGSDLTRTRNSLFPGPFWRRCSSASRRSPVQCLRSGGRNRRARPAGTPPTLR